MPRKITAYACSFRCGQRIQSVKSRIARHETWCFLNPLNRCCPTCKHECLGYDDEYGRWCERDLLGDSGVDDKGRKRIKTKCHEWQPKK